MKFGKYLILISVFAVLLLTACARETEHEHPELDSQIAALQQDAGLYNLIIDGFDGVPTTPRLPDHVYKAIDSGQFVFLHFDKALPEATKILYTGRIVPGKFCKEDQDKLPPGFTHFHKKSVDSDNPQDGHGGEGGEEGYWFVHIAVAEFDMPWGHVTPGVDMKFMPTPPPSCKELGIEGYQ